MQINSWLLYADIYIYLQDKKEGGKFFERTAYCTKKKLDISLLDLENMTGINASSLSKYSQRTLKIE